MCCGIKVYTGQDSPYTVHAYYNFPALWHISIVKSHQNKFCLY